MEAVAPHAPVAPASRHGVRRRLVGDRRVERRVEDRDVRDVRQRSLRLVDRRAAPARCAAARAPSSAAISATHRFVDHDRLTKARAAVHDSMRDRLDVPGRSDSTFLDSSPVDDVQLQARRAGVDDEDGLVRPDPVAHVRVILAVLARPGAAAKASDRHLLTEPEPPVHARPGTRSIASTTRWKRSSR